MVRDVHFSDYIWGLFERNGAFFAKVVPEIIKFRKQSPTVHYYIIQTLS